MAVDWDAVIERAKSDLKAAAAPLVEPTIAAEVRKRVISQWVVVGLIAFIILRDR